jgi:uncharacterized protein involved in exopolysaccharide biosynthesis
MPDISLLLKNWWKQILFVVVLTVLAVGVVTFLKPKKYLSVATSVPASSFAADKSRIFSENIQQLYSAMGNPDDLDKILGTAKLDTVYLAVTDQFNLFDHYKVKVPGEAARLRSASLLKKNSRVMKSEYGELKVKVWDTDRNLAPQLANAITDQLQQIHTQLQGAGNETTLMSLTRQKEKLESQLDSAVATEKIETYRNQIAEYDKMIGQYQLLVDNKPGALLVVEKAKPAVSADKPRILQLLFAAAVLSFLFAFLMALVLERKKSAVQ